MGINMRVYEKQLMTLIKQKARTIQLSQVQIASQLGVSLPTVKRWWAGQGVSVTVLNMLSGLLGTSMSQLFLEFESGVAEYSYSLEQEQMLANNPRVLALFDLLVSGESIASIRRTYKLNEAELWALLLKLDRFGLIELHAGNKVKLKRKGEPTWLPDGPLTTMYRKKMIEAFLGQHAKPASTFFIHSYLPEDVALLKGKLKELENLMRTCNARGILRPDKTESHGAYLCFNPFEWSLREKLRSSQVSK